MNARRLAILVLLVVSLGVVSLGSDRAAGEALEPIALWSGRAPGEGDALAEEHELPQRPGDTTIRVTDVTRPTITVFRPASDKNNDKNNGAAVLVCPGGGYKILAWNKEGTAVAEWLNSLGITGVVLKYRVPPRNERPRHAAPLQDAQRAMGLVRQHATEWGIDPQRVGVLGFSAGGHLAAALSNNHDRRTYDPVDAADSLDCRPNFALLIYPAYLTVPEEGFRLAPELPVTERTPPTFLVQTQDDGVRVESSVYYFLALKNAKVPSELHVFPAGGHGYGMRAKSPGIDHWPDRAAEWLVRFTASN